MGEGEGKNCEGEFVLGSEVGGGSALIGLNHYQIITCYLKQLSVQRLKYLKWPIYILCHKL